jgi:hypothetical protein
MFCLLSYVRAAAKHENTALMVKGCAAPTMREQPRTSFFWGIF